MTQGASAGTLSQSGGLGWGGRWVGGSGGRGICIHVTDSCYCVEETNTIL